jgi:hypothetical protein
MKKTINVEAEGSELILKNKLGDIVIIPKKDRTKIQKYISSGCHDCIDKYIDRLPTAAEYANDGSRFPRKGGNVITEIDEVIDNEDNEPVESTTGSTTSTKPAAKPIIPPVTNNANNPVVPADIIENKKQIAVDDEEVVYNKNIDANAKLTEAEFIERAARDGMLTASNSYIPEVSVYATDGSRLEAAYKRNNPLDLEAYIEKRFNAPIGHEAAKRIDAVSWREYLRQEGIRKYQEAADINTARELMRLRPQGDTDRVSWLESFTDKEQEVLTKLPENQSTIWNDTRQGFEALSSVNPMAAIQSIMDNSNYTRNEKIEILNNYKDHPVLSGLGQIGNALSMLTIPAKMVQSSYKDDYSIGDALTGEKNDANMAEEILLDPLNLIGIGIWAKLSKLNKFKNLGEAYKSVEGLSKASKLQTLRAMANNAVPGLRKLDNTISETANKALDIAIPSRIDNKIALAEAEHSKTIKEMGNLDVTANDTYRLLIDNKNSISDEQAAIKFRAIRDMDQRLNKRDNIRDNTTENKRTKPRYEQGIFTNARDGKIINEAMRVEGDKIIINSSNDANKPAMIIDYATGEEVHFKNTVKPTTETTLSREGEYAENVVDEMHMETKYLKTVSGNKNMVEDMTGGKAFGSSALVIDGKLNHTTHDLDFLITQADYDKNVANKLKHVQDTTFSKKHTINPEFGEQGELDFVIIQSNKKTGKAQGHIANELFRQLDPDAYFAAAEYAIKNNKEIVIPYTAKELLDKTDTVLKTAMDYFISDTPKHGFKIFNMIANTDKAFMRKAQLKHAQGLFGSEVKLAPNFNFKAMSKESKIKLIREMKYDLKEPYLSKIVDDDERMQLLMNEWYVKNTGISRGLDSDKNIAKWLDDSLYGHWKLRTNKGGQLRDVSGLNAVKTGNSKHGDVYANLQLKLKHSDTDPFTMMEEIKRQTDGLAELSPEDLEIVQDIARKYNIPEDKVQKMRCGKDFGKAFLANDDTGKAFDEFTERTGIRIISTDDYGNSTYASIAGKIDRKIEEFKLARETEGGKGIRSRSQRTNEMAIYNENMSFKTKGLTKDELERKLYYFKYRNSSGHKYKSRTNDDDFKTLEGYIKANSATLDIRIAKAKKSFDNLESNKQAIIDKMIANKVEQESATNEQLIKLKAENKVLEENFKTINGELQVYRQRLRDLNNAVHDMVKLQDKYYDTRVQLMAGSAAVGVAGGLVAGISLLDPFDMMPGDDVDEKLLNESSMNLLGGVPGMPNTNGKVSESDLTKYLLDNPDVVQTLLQRNASDEINKTYNNRDSRRKINYLLDILGEDNLGNVQTIMDDKELYKVDEDNLARAVYNLNTILIEHAQQVKKVTDANFMYKQVENNGLRSKNNTMNNIDVHFEKLKEKLKSKSNNNKNFTKTKK